MGDAEYKILLCHGSSKYEVAVSGALTLADLGSRVEAATHIPQSSQKILFKGKNLTDPNVTLSSYGIGPGSKVMVLGKKYDPEDDASYRAVAQVECSCNEVEKKLHSILPEVDRVANGYVEPHLCGETLSKLKKQLLGVNEEFMRLLEQLDGISCEENQAPARQKRRSMVRRIQQLMERTDQVQENINHLIKSYS